MKSIVIKKKGLLIIVIGSILLALLFCIPFLNGYIKVGPDTTFHMNRIESIKESIENGVLYPYIYTEQNYGFGYGTAAFYGQLFLYPAVLLRFIGFNIASTWRIYIFLIILSISISMCLATKSITKISNPYLLLTPSALCIFNTYLISRAHQRAALGELLALVFIPLVIKETHKLITEKDVNNWVNLGLFFSCILMSHNISFILMIIVFGLTLIINLKKIVANKNILVILKATVFSILLSAFFLFPLLEQLRVGIYNIGSSITSSSNLYGMTLQDYLDFNTMEIGAKLALNLSLIIIPLISFFTKNKGTLYISIIGCLLIFLSSCLFPWDYIIFLNFIQFPSRALTIALPYLSIASVIAIDWSLSNRNKIVTIIVSLALIESLIASIVSINNILHHFGAINNSTTREQIKTGVGLYEEKDINFSYNIPETSGNEYLPLGMYDYYTKSLTPKIESSDQKVDLLYKNYNEQNYELTVKNDTTFVFPKTYYKGYVVSIYKDGNYIETVTTKPDEKMPSFVSVTIDDSYKGQEIQLQLVYKNTKIQKISIVISLTTLICAIGYLICKKKKSI